MEATSAPPILLPGIDHLPCPQEIRSAKDKPFYCQSSVGTIPFQGRVFLLLAFCKQSASLQRLVSHMATVCLSTNCPKHACMLQGLHTAMRPAFLNRSYSSASQRIPCPSVANGREQPVYQRGVAPPWASQSCAAKAGLLHKPWLSSYTFSTKGCPFQNRPIACGSLRCASVGAIHDEYNDVLLSFSMLLTICCL